MEKLKLETTGTNATNRSYYVYIHLENNIPVYVGQGQNYRAWNSGRDKNLLHSEWMKNNLKWMDKTHNISLIEGLSHRESLDKEAELIAKYLPRFNATPTRLEEQRKEAISNRIASGKNAAVCSVSVTNRNLKRAVCPTCGKEGGMMAMARWHGLDGSKCNYL